MWYVMQVRTGTEENIRCQCQRTIDRRILERCFIPYYQQKKRFQGQWHIQERILFPGYVFLIAENLEPLMENLKHVIGMTRIIGTGETIVPLTDQEVELLIRMGGDKEQLVRLSQGIIQGDRYISQAALSREWKEPSGKSTDTSGSQCCHWICSGGRWI